MLVCGGRGRFGGWVLGGSRSVGGRERREMVAWDEVMTAVV